MSRRRLRGSGLDPLDVLREALRLPWDVHRHYRRSGTRMPSGVVYEVCECGATRTTPAGPASWPPVWHTCPLCTAPWGMPT